MSTTMQEYKKKQAGDWLKQTLKEASRASRVSKVGSGLNASTVMGSTVIRESSIIGLLSRQTNFDYLGLREESNKLCKLTTRFLEAQGENKHSLVLFTDYMYKINSHLSKTKRILLVTEKNLYSLSLNLSLVMKLPLDRLQRVTLIRNSSAALVMHP